MSVVFERNGDTLVALLSGEIDHHSRGCLCWISAE